MKIYIGADHRGFYLKEQIRVWLKSQKFTVVDLGNTVYDSDDDFPDFGLAVALAVSGSDNVGILFCGSGGMAMVANKVKGIRAVEAFDEKRAIHAKSHDHANILSLPADVVRLPLAKKIVSAWLGTAPLCDEKRLRRLRKIEAIEQKMFRDV